MASEDAVAYHLFAILVEATRLHKEAMSQLDSPKADPLPQLREAKRLLAEVEILASDAASYVDATQMDSTLADLHRQQGQVDAMIAHVESRKRHTNNGAWGWIIIVVLLGIVVILAV
jgi:streptomycin 6-kinase